MITKIIFPDSFDFGMPTATLLPVHSRGVDKGFIEKRAALFDNEHDRFERKPGYEYLHLITVGAGERYGSNNNGDYFNKTAAQHRAPYPKFGANVVEELDGGLLKYHDTMFEKHASIYKHHKNKHKNGVPSGYIVKAAYNHVMDRGELICGVQKDAWSEELQKMASDVPIFWSMGCFVAGTPIMTADGGWISIDQVKSGTGVTTHRGNTASVSTVRERTLVADRTTVDLAGGLEIVSTADHPYSTIPRELIMNKGRLKKDISSVTELMDWKHAGCLRKGDFLCMPIDREVVHPDTVTREFARLAGYYLAEGYILRDAAKSAVGVRFIVNKNEYETREIPELCAVLSGKELTYHGGGGDSQSLSITIYDHSLAAEFAYLFSCYAKKKKLHASVLKWDPEMQKEFLGAYCNGDGGFVSKRNVDTKGNAYFSTASLELALQLQTLMPRLGGCASLNVLTHKTSKSQYTKDGQTIEYRVWLYRDATRILRPYTCKIPKLDEPDARCGAVGRLLVGDYQIIRIAGVSTEKAVEFTVYNCEVDHEDHSYIAAGVGVHNCDTPADLCSSCNNRAHSREEYCGHLKTAMLSIDMMGNQVYAITDTPYFHDMSRVVKPADKICYTLRKVASAGGVLSGADLAEIYGMVPSAAMMHQFMGKKASSRLDLLRKLAEIEKEIMLAPSGSSKKALLSAFESGSGFGDVDDSVIQRLSKQPTGAVLGALKDKLIIMPVDVFFKMILGDKYPEAEPLMPDTKECVPGILGRLLEDPGLGELLGDGSYETERSSDRSLKGDADSMAPACSISEEPVMMRIVRAVMGASPSGSGRVTIIKTSALRKNSAAEFLAREYARYVLSFAEGLPDERNRLTVAQMLATVI